MAEKTDKPNPDQRAVLEWGRQIVKQNQFIVHAVEVLEASVTAEKDLPAKKQEVAAVEKLLTEARETHAAALDVMKADAGRVRGELDAEYARVKVEWTKAIDGLKRQEANLRTRVSNLEKEVGGLENEKIAAERALQEIGERARMAKENAEKQFVAQKAELQTELDSLRQAIRTLRTGVERLPA